MENASDQFTIEECREARLSQFCLDRASVCALRLDQDGRILYANREASRTLGYLPAELLKMSVFDIDPNVGQDMWPQIWQKLCEDGANTFESLHRRKDGTLFPIEVTATLIEFEGRRYRGMRFLMSHGLMSTIEPAYCHGNAKSFAVNGAKDPT